MGAKSTGKPKFVNLLFLAITRSDYDFVKYRHSLDSKAFDVLKEEYEVQFFKTHEPDYQPYEYNSDEVFVPGRNWFFSLPLKMCWSVRRQNPAIIFIHGFVFPVQLLCLKLFLRPETKLIVQHHAENPFMNPIKR